MKKILEIIKEKQFKYIYFFCFILSIQSVLGYKLQKFEHTAEKFSDVIINILEIICLSVALTTIFYIGKYIIEKIKEKKEIKQKDNTETSKTHKKEFDCISFFLIMFLCWMPAFLSFCPGLLNYDGPSQIISYSLVQKTMSTQQPIISTVLMSFFYLIGTYAIGSATFGMTLFTLFQMIFMASVFTYAINFIWKETKNKWITIITLIFYAIFPFNQLFPLMTTKDTIFAGLTLIFVVQLYKSSRENFKIKEYILMSIFAVFMLLFRNNAVYALVVAIPFSMLCLRKNKKKMLNIGITFVIIVIIYQACFEGLIIATKSMKQSDKEKLSVLSQAMARVAKEKKEELTEEEIEKLNYYFNDVDELINIYETNISDNTKGKINIPNYNKNPKEFYQLFLTFVKKYPYICIDSFLDTIRGYWYIFDNSFNQIFHKESPYTKGCLELESYVISNGTAEGTVRNIGKLPKVSQFYKKLLCENNYTKIPILYIIFQPAIYFYIVLACLLYAIYKKDKNLELPTIYLVLYFLTCFLGPGAIVRYIYANIVTTPVILAMAKKREEKREE